MSRDTTEKVSTAGAPAAGTKAAMPPVPGPDGSDGARGASTPANGTPKVRPAESSGTPPTIAPKSSASSPASSPGAATSTGTTSGTGSASDTGSAKAGTGKAAGAAAPTGTAKAATPVGAKPAAGATGGSRPGQASASTSTAPRSLRPAPSSVGMSESTAAAASAKKAAGAPRKVRLSVSRIDPWSVMKLSFLLSIAMGIMLVVAAVIFWLVLDGLHVFTEVNDMIVQILQSDSQTPDILQYVELNRFVSLATIIAIVDVVIFTALGTIGAFLYNIVAALVGGIHLTMTDD